MCCNQGCCWMMEMECVLGVVSYIKLEPECTAFRVVKC